MLVVFGAPTGVRIPGWDHHTLGARDSTPIQKRVEGTVGVAGITLVLLFAREHWAFALAFEHPSQAHVRPRVFWGWSSFLPSIMALMEVNSDSRKRRMRSVSA